MRRVDDTNTVRRALAAVGRRAARPARQAHPRRRRAGRRLGRRRRRAALGRLRRPRRGRVARAPTCRSASSAAGRGCTGIGEVVEPLPFEDRDLHAADAAARVSTAAVYRAWDALGGPHGERRQRPRAGRAAVEPRWPTGATGWATRPGCTPRLAGSGSTWFVEGAFPADGPGRDANRPPLRAVG